MIIHNEFKKKFPSFIDRSVQKQITDIELNDFIGFYEITEKIDGLPCIIYKDKDKFQICLANENNSFLGKMAEKYKDVLEDIPEHHVLYGEIIGSEIKENYYGLKSFIFYLSDIFDIAEGAYLSSDDRHEWLNDFTIGYPEKIFHVPVLCELSIEKNSDNSYNLNFYGTETGNDYLLTNLSEIEIKNEIWRYAERNSILNLNVESKGIVLKNVDNPDLSFQVILNDFLLNNEKKQEKKSCVCKLVM